MNVFIMRHIPSPSRPLTRPEVRSAYYAMMYSARAAGLRDARGRTGWGYGEAMNPKRLLRKIRSGGLNNIAFNDLRRLLSALDFELLRIEGDHYIFARDDIREQPNLQPDRNGQAKPYQVKQLQRLVEKYNLGLEE